MEEHVEMFKSYDANPDDEKKEQNNIRWDGSYAYVREIFVLFIHNNYLIISCFPSIKKNVYWFYYTMYLITGYFALKNHAFITTLPPVIVLPIKYEQNGHFSQCWHIFYQLFFVYNGFDGYLQ